MKKVIKAEEVYGSVSKAGMCLILSCVLVLTVVAGSLAQSYSGLNYGPSSTNKIDLYIPDSGNGPYPIVVWIHGGAWMAGDRTDSNAGVLADMLNPEGIAVASIDHTMSSGAIWPVQSQECKASIRWIRANAEEYGIDPDHIGTAGLSSGGHLASFLGTSGGVEEATVGDVTMDLEGDIGGNTEYSSSVQAVYDMYGPANLPTMGDPCPSNNPEESQIDHDAADSPEGMLIGGAVPDNIEKAKLASPIHFVSEDDPPFLISHGTDDALVPNCQSKELYDALDEAFAQNGKEHSLYILDGQQHGFSVDVNEDTVIAFFKRHLIEETSIKTSDNTAVSKLSPKVSLKNKTLSLSAVKPMQFKILSVSGRVISSGNLHSERTVDLSKVGSGILLCELEAGDGRIYRYKIVCP